MVRSDQGRSLNLFSIMLKNYFMLLLLMTIENNSMHTKAKIIRNKMFLYFLKTIVLIFDISILLSLFFKENKKEMVEVTL